MRYEAIRDIASLAALSEPWRALLDHAVAPSPMKSPTWLFAWLRQFGEDDGRRMASLAFYDGDALVGLVPLTLRVVRSHDLLPIRLLETIGTGESRADEICSDYVGPIVAADRVADVAEAAAKCLADGVVGAFDELLMPMMDGADPFLAAFAAALDAHGMQTHVLDQGASLHVPLPKTFDAYVHALDRDRRYVVTRALRELEKWAGPSGYRMVRARSAVELAEGRRILHSLHGERWSDASGYAGVFASKRFAAFHDEVMPKLLEGRDGRLDLWWLIVKDRPVAALYNIVYRGKVYFYQSGRALDVPKGLKIGVAAHALAMRAAIDEGLADYDFLAGESQYKRQLALASQPLKKLLATGPSVRARAVARTVVGMEHAVAFVRRGLVRVHERLVKGEGEPSSKLRRLVVTSIERHVHALAAHGRKRTVEKARPPT